MAFSKYFLIFSFCAGAMAQNASQTTLAGKYGDLPVAFEENRGQADSHALYLMRGGNLNLFVTRTGAVLTMRKGETRAAVRLEIADALVDAKVSGESAMAGRSNYFRGSNPSRWLSGIPQYERVRITGIRNGVDLLCYANEKQFEYDLVVKPGTRPENIRLRFKGAENVSLTSAGDLKIQTAAGDLIQHKPQVWQQAGIQREMIAGSYRISKDGEVSITLGKYDLNRELVIDPVVSYSTFLGGRSSDQAAAIAVDASGNAYIIGTTTSPDFPTTVGAYRVAQSNNTEDVFVTKLNANGTALLYSTYLGGSTLNLGSAIAIDSGGNAYVTGTTLSTDFPVTSGAFQNTNLTSPPFNYTNIFVTKINPGGTALLYSTYLGGTNTQAALGIKADASGNAYIVGTTQSSNFPTTGGAYTTVLPNAQAAFVTKLNPAGTSLVYSTFLGGTDGFSSANAVGLDSSNNAYVAGLTAATNFPTTAGAYQRSVQTGTTANAFISELSVNGTTLSASTYLGAGAVQAGFPNDTGASAIALDSSNNPYITGYTESASFPVTPNPFLTKPTNSGSHYYHAFVTKLNASLTSLTYSSYLGGSVYDRGAAIALDSAGGAYVAGYTASADFPTTPNAIFGKKNQTVAANETAFLSQINPAGTSLVYSTFLGGTVTEAASGIAVDAALGVYLAGITSSNDFPVSAGAYQTTVTDPVQPGTNAFIAKLDLGSQVSCALSVSPAGYLAPVTGATSSFAITVPQGCPWVLNSLGSSVTINGPTRGFGNATISFSVASNAGASQGLSVGILVGSSTFTVTQPASGQTISFGSLGSATILSAPFSIAASASSGLPVAFTSNTPAICTVSGSTVTILSTGDCSITATQPGNGTYAPAPSVTQGFTVQAGPRAAKVGVFRFGFYWLEDVNGDQQFAAPPDRSFAYGGVPGDIPITGDWTGSGTTKVGVYRPSNGLFILDSNGNGTYDAGDAVYNLGLGIQPGDVPVTGDWNGDGRSKIGLFRNGYFWILDFNGNGVFDQGVDKAFAFGGDPTDVPVVGDWTGTGISKVGVFRKGFLWILDTNGNGSFDGVGPGLDSAFAYGGIAGDVPVVGDWNGSGTTKVGVFRYGYFWVIDKNGNQQFDGVGPGQDTAFAFGGSTGDKPVLGIW